MTDRAALRARLDACVARLVARAAAERWPIRADHCFLRIAYDVAVGAKWDTLHARPAWLTLPLDTLVAAVSVSERIEAGGREMLVDLNRRSLEFRQTTRQTSFAT